MSNLNISRGLVSSLLILSLSVLAFADTIRLKDGGLIKGKIVSFGSGKFLIAMGEGSRRREISFTAAEIESIQFDTPREAVSTNRNASYGEPVAKTVISPVTITDKPDVSRRSSPVPANPPSSKMGPIEWRVKVLADNTNNGWTNSGWVIKKGQRIRIVGNGSISLGRGQTSTAAGIGTLDDGQKIMKNVATGALVAVIGDDNNDFIYIGGEREFTATRDGSLFLGINEGNLNDNTGAFDVKIEVIP